jgi:hypothetical protein
MTLAENFTSFIIMELLDGDSLFERRPQSLDETVRLRARFAMPSSTPTPTASFTAIGRERHHHQSGVAKLTDFDLGARLPHVSP